MAWEFQDPKERDRTKGQGESEGRALEKDSLPDKDLREGEDLHHEEDPGGVTERRRSQSGVTPPEPAAEEPQEEPVGEDDRIAERDGLGDGEDHEETPRHQRPFPFPRLSARRRGRLLAKPKERVVLSPQQRLLLLDTWRRSGLPARDFSALVGISRHTLYAWKKRFKDRGPSGLEDQPRGGPRGSRLSEITKRTILMLKEEHPEWGSQRISDTLARGPALWASPPTVARALREAGYELEETPTRTHRAGPRRFEREKSNDLWQTDLFTFVLKRQNRRVYLVVYLDDHSRFIVGWGLRGSPSSELVLETLRTAILNYRAPREILTDNGSQYVTWRGKSAFSKELERRGVKHIVATPRRPQTLGKVERFWGSLWRECVERAVFVDFEDARRRLGHYIDHYNFQRPHQGIDGLFPADRYFGAAREVLRTLKERVQSNALELAREGIPPKPFYLTGQVAGEGFSVHAEGERVILKRADGEREEVELVSPKRHRDEIPPSISETASVPLPEEEKHEGEPPAGTSPIDRLVGLGGGEDVEEEVSDE